jgi:NAD(P)H-hydrate epimerase
MMRELPKPLVQVPSITAAQMQVVERLMVEEYQLDPMELLEVAGRHLAHLARVLFLKGKADGKALVLLASPSPKGGSVFAAARRLHQWGANVRLVLSHDIVEFEGLAAAQLDRVQRQGLIIVEPPSLGGNVIVDGLMQGGSAGRIAELIEWANRQLSPVLSLEVPVGLDVETGAQARPCMRASATMALGLPKAGILKEGARAVVGEIYLADIGVPPALYAAPGLDLKVGAVFSESDIVRLR